MYNFLSILYLETEERRLCLKEHINLSVVVEPEYTVFGLEWLPKVDKKYSGRDEHGDVTH